MDKRKNYYIIFDTETCNGFVNEKQQLDLSCSLVYDIGWMIIDKQGNVYAERSFVNADIFDYEKELMQSAYYSEKIPIYKQDIMKGKRILESFYDIRKQLLQDAKKWNIKAFVAHNALFDYNATNNTQRWLTKSKYRYFLPYGVPLFDTMKMASDTIAKEKGYINFCFRNGYVTKHKKPRPQVKAEVLYKYISGQYDFIESHTGLEDVKIEKEIFIVCMKKHKRMRKSAWDKKKST